MLFLLTSLAQLASQAEAAEPASEAVEEGLPDPLAEESEQSSESSLLEQVTRDSIWVPVTGPWGDIPLVDVEEGTDFLLAIDKRGAIWLKGALSSRWTPLLSAEAEPAEDDEERLLQAETNLLDLFEEEAEEAESEDEAPGELDLPDLLALDQLQESGSDGPGSFEPRLVRNPEGGWWVLRADGVWSLDSYGRQLSLESEQVLFDVGRAGREGQLLGQTTWGLELSDDLSGPWTRYDAVSPELPMISDALSVWYQDLWGLHYSLDGSIWVDVLAPAVLDSMVLDQGTLWGSSGLVVFSWSGEWESWEYPVPEGARELTLLQDDLWWIQTAAGSHLLSRDKGESWQPLPAQSEVERFVITSTGVIYAQSRGGLWRLSEPSLNREKLSTFNPDIGWLMDRARDRIPLPPARSRMGRWLPSLVLIGQYQQDETFGADYENRLNLGDFSERWVVYSELRWGGERGNSSAYTQTSEDLAERLYVIDGQVYSTNNPRFLNSATSRLGTKASSMQLAVAETLRELYQEYQQLRLSSTPEDLSERVLRELRLQELVALLDVYTDGAMTASSRPESL